MIKKLATAFTENENCGNIGFNFQPFWRVLVSPPRGHCTLVTYIYNRTEALPTVNAGQYATLHCKPINQSINQSIIYLEMYEIENHANNAAVINNYTV